MPRSRLFIWFLKKGFPFRLFFSKFTRVPLLGQLMDYMMFHEDDIIYLPKDEVSTIVTDYSKNELIEIKQPIQRHGEMVVPSQIIDYFIEEANFHWIMDWCICRSSSSCRNYPIELGCLFLGEAAMKIDPKLGKPVSEEEAKNHVRRCREAGLVHLIGRNKLDTVWLKVKPGYKLLTICNCCECCCLWKILPHVSDKIASKITKMPGVDVTSNHELCTGCGQCESICFVKAIEIVDNKSVIGTKCRGCGRCVEVCPKSAIKLSIKGLENFNQSIDRLEELVDVT